MRPMGNFVLYRNGKNFNPRTPYGMRRVHKRKIAYTVEFQSTHPLRDATVDAKHALFMAIISIHAPLTGCDDSAGYSMAMQTDISIHAPLTGCDHNSRVLMT